MLNARGLDKNTELGESEVVSSDDDWLPQLPPGTPPPIPETHRHLYEEAVRMQNIAKRASSNATTILKQ